MLRRDPAEHRVSLTRLPGALLLGPPHSARGASPAHVASRPAPCCLTTVLHQTEQGLVLSASGRLRARGGLWDLPLPGAHSGRSPSGTRSSSSTGWVVHVEEGRRLLAQRGLRPAHCGALMVTSPDHPHESSDLPKSTPTSMPTSSGQGHHREEERLLKKRRRTTKKWSHQRRPAVPASLPEGRRRGGHGAPPANRRGQAEGAHVVDAVI